MSSNLAPSAHLEADYDRRFGGLSRLLGERRTQSLRAAHIVVVGVGGVGSWAAEALARSGVGRLSLIDMDVVAESNIQRQVQAHSLTLGAAKVDALRERIRLIHPACTVDAMDAFVEAETWSTLLPVFTAADAILDACDDIRAKTHMAAWILTRAKDKTSSQPVFICCGAAGGKQHILGSHGLRCADLAQVSHDPVLAKLRYNLRKHHGAARPQTPGKTATRIGIPCLYSPEPVQAPLRDAQVCASDGSLNCAGYGSCVTVTASFGLAAANFVLQALSKPK